MQNEPEYFKQGKIFHQQIQEEWLHEAKDGRILNEKVIARKIGRKGRIDILVEDLGDFVSVIEIKGTDWDKILPQNIRRNALRQARQIWSYIEAQIDLCGRQVCPGVIFQHLPCHNEVLQTVETIFNDQGIQVVWHNEDIEQLKKRMGGK